MKLRRNTMVMPLIVLLLASPSAVMAALLPGVNVNISNLTGAQSEVGIAVNPTNLLNLVAVSNNIADLSQLGTWFSIDGGVTWTPNFLDENEDGFGANDSRFDPNVAFDSDGNVYVVYSTTGTGNRLLLARSTDGGQNFNLVTTVTTDAGTNNLHTAMVTTRSDAGGDDDVLVVWARVQAGGESIEAALSLDAGATFLTTNNNINDALQRTFLPWAAVDANGDFHVVWEVNQGGGAGVILHDSLDGVTLADGANSQVTTVQITDFAAATSRIPAQPDRGIFSVTTVDVDRSTGRLYVSYTDRPNTASNDTDIFVRLSDNNGATWSARIQVNDDTTTTSQFMPRIAIDQTTGVVYAMWYDARNDVVNNQQVDVFVATSLDDGLTWSHNQRLTTARSDESTANPARDGNNYGEYSGLTAHGGVAYAAWTDARAANFTAGTNEDVYTAVVVIPAECPEDPNAVITRAVDPEEDDAALIHGLPTYKTLQDAVDAANDDDVIGFYGRSTENVIIDGAQSLTITQCTVAQITAAGAGPVVDITSTGEITIVSLDTVGGTIGWRVGTDGHDLKSVRATGASQFGILVVGNSNSVSYNSVRSSAVGISVEGSFNDLRGGTVERNAGAGVQLAMTASSNTFRTANVQLNGGNGIVVEGSSNTVRDNGRVNQNTLNGILVTGDSNTLLANRSEAGKGNGRHGIEVVAGADNNQLTSNNMNSSTMDGFHVFGTRNKLKSNNASANTASEFNLGPGNVDQGGNKANGRSCTFGAGGGSCN